MRNSQNHGFTGYSTKGLNSTKGFSNFNLNKPFSKKDLLIKPTISIGYSLPSDRLNKNEKKQNIKSNPNFNCSRFNSFIKDTKQMSIPATLEEALDNGYLPT